jgi:serine/threonine protein kinase
VDRLGHGDFYKLTSKVGSIPYMAPEVALSKPYNEKCDVFSFGILFYEIMTLKPPYVIFDKKDYFRKVIQGGKRPQINKKFPLMTKEIMKLSWATSPFDRPSMDNICDMTKFDLEEHGIDECIQTRLEFLINISRHSTNRLFNIDNSELEQSHH